jgi:hypothetical protein
LRLANVKMTRLSSQSLTEQIEPMVVKDLEVAHLEWGQEVEAEAVVLPCLFKNALISCKRSTEEEVGLEAAHSSE